jgi:hypothetical protein
MSVEILLLIVLGAVTLVGYIVALNAQGPKRLAVSYLLATAILVVSVWATVQYVNSGDNRKKMEAFQKLESEKQKAEDLMHSQEAAMQVALRENKERLSIASRFNAVINRGTALATAMVNANLRDMNSDVDALVGRASDSKRKAEDLAGEFDKMKVTDTLFFQSASLIKEALKQLSEAAQYYTLYYRAEDSAQEELRERIMRQKAGSSHDLLQKAGALIAPSGS